MADEITPNEKIANVQVQTINGLRRAKALCKTKFEEFPKLITTTTNTGHIKNFEDKSLDFNISIHQIFSWAEISDLRSKDDDLWKKLVKRAKPDFTKNEHKFCFLFIPSFFKTTKIKSKDILKSIELQKKINIIPTSVFISPIIQ